MIPPVRRQRILLAIEDITERRQAEAAQTRLAAIIESSDDAIVSQNMDGVIASWNVGAGWLFGYMAQEAVGRPLSMLIPPDREDEEPRILERISRGESIEHYETVRLCKNGSTVEVSLTVSPIRDTQGRITGVSKIYRNITVRKGRETVLHRLTEELEARVDERTGELVVSQERLRALAVELNLTEQRERQRLATDLHDYLAQLLALSKIKLGQVKQQPMVPPVTKAVTEVQEVLDQALTYTRTLVAQLSPPMLNEFGLSMALKWLVEQMQRQGLTVSLAFEGRPLVLAKDQATLLFQSVRELLLNVVKHAETNEARIVVTQADGTLRIVVSDQGAGCDLAAAVAGDDKPHFGLFSIGERMRALGGGFDIESAPGQGTTATLVLPLTPQTPKAANAELGMLNDKLSKASTSHHSSFSTQHSELPPQARKVRVLLADDHAMVRQGLKSILDAYPNIAVVGDATDGEEAVELARTLSPDVIVMDVNMPKMDGIEATRRIKAQRPAMLIVGLSLAQSGQVESLLREAGASTFVSKEAAVDHLYETIMAAMKQGHRT